MILIDLRKEKLEDKQIKVKLNYILTSFQLLFFSSTLVVIEFILVTIRKIIDREVIKESTNPNYTVYLTFTIIILVFNFYYLIENILQLIFGFGLKYLKNIWCSLDFLLILFLLTMEILIKVGWRDTTLGTWRFLVVLRLLRVLALMSEYTAQSLIEKKEKREELEHQIGQIKMNTITEDMRNVALKEQLRLAVLKLCKVEKSLIHSKKDAEVLTRRYSTSI